MPTPLSPSSSQEIVPISPPPTAYLKKGFPSSITSSSSIKYPSSSKVNRDTDAGSRSYASIENSVKMAASSSSLKYGGFSELADPSLSPRPDRATRDRKLEPKQKEKQRITSSTHWSKKDVEDKEKRKAIDSQREELSKKSRSEVTQRMLSTRGKDLNPITNSDLYSRTDHFVSCSTGHQQSNRGGGSEGSMTYWQVRSAQVNDQARAKQTDILKGCLIYLNGSSGPKISNLQMQHLITTNGGRIAPLQSSSCTHIIANGGLSGSKTQKHIDGQGKRGASRRAKVVKVEWLLDSVKKGQRLSEAGYGMVEDPSQPNLFKTLGVKPKVESESST